MSVKLLLILTILKLVESRYVILEIPDFVYEDNWKNEISLHGRRLKRDLSLNKNSDEYEIRGEKVYKDDTQSLTALGALTGLKPGEYGYKSADVSLNYNNIKGHNAELSAQHTPNSDVISAQGKAILLNTDKHQLDATAHFNKEITQKGDKTNFGGAIDYINRNGHSATLSAQHDSTLGDILSAKGKASVVNTDVHKLDANAYYKKYVPSDPFKFPTSAYGANLDYSHRNGHSANIGASHIPDLGDQLLAAGKVNLYHNDNHNLDAIGSISRTFPSEASIPSFNSYAGSLDYTYKDKAGASLGMRHSDLFDRTDYSAMGNLNLYRDKDSSFDFNAGATKTIMPNFNSDWTPTFQFQFKKEF